jgi:beta-glucosidase
MWKATSTFLATWLVILASAQPKAETQLYPAPWGAGGPDGWDEAYEKAKAFVAQLTVTEKVNLTTGTGWNADRCVGVTGGIPRLGFSGLCLEDGPLGVRYGELSPPSRSPSYQRNYTSHWYLPRSAGA